MEKFSGRVLDKNYSKRKYTTIAKDLDKDKLFRIVGMHVVGKGSWDKQEVGIF